MTMNMTISLVGMPVREAAALTIFIGVGVKGASCQTVTFRPGLALPPADLCVIDMAGIGLAQWSAKAEADLLTLLGGKNALLLLFPSNTSWAGKAQGHGRQMLHCMTKPYSSEDMRAALARLGSGSTAPAARPEPVLAAGLHTYARPEPVLAAGLHTPVRPAARPELVFAGRPAVPARAAVRATAGQAASRQPFQSSLQALRTMFPDLDRHLLLARLLDLVATNRPQELRLTLHHSIVLHPAQGWVAHNAAPGMLDRLAQDGSAVTTMSVRELDSEQALLRAGTIQCASTGLDTFLWMLAESSFGQKTPSALRDAELKLRSIPGFTRIPGVGNLSVQLAAICVRLPQTLSNLRAAFPEHDPLEISRFMLLSTVSGLGNLSLVTVNAGVAPGVSAVPRPAQRESGGFFRAMLQKLF